MFVKENPGRKKKKKISNLNILVKIVSSSKKGCFFDNVMIMVDRVKDIFR